MIDRLARGDVYKRLITFREGLTIPEMALVFEERGFGAAADFERAARNGASLVTDLDPAAKTLEGYLFPETYALPRGTSAEELVSQMVGLFKRLYTDQMKAEAEAAGLTTRQVVTLASLVEKETARREERPLVAAVYRNRLKIGMGMQADPTVIYALQQAGKYDGNLSRDDLQFDSPYNTYRYAGSAAGADRRAGPGVDRGGAAGRRRWRICTSSAATTVRTCSPTTLDAAQPQRPGVAGALLPRAPQSLAATNRASSPA